MNAARLFLVGLALAVLGFYAFAGVSQCDFVNYDDPEYVTANPYVQQGLTAESVTWAFTHAYVANYHPLTWVSHMIDVEMHGLDPAGHHRNNVFVHVVATVLLFLLGVRLTGQVVWSAWVAALFAVHPMHVESVAWISERKDTLSAVFGLICVHLYLSWVRRPRPWRYGLMLFAFALGLLAKPMLVTLPGVFLVLDFWPLRRGATWRRLALEKAPMLALVAISSVVTLLAQRGGRATHDTDSLPLLDRLSNAVVATVTYLDRLFAPRDMAAFYPHPAFLDVAAGPSVLRVGLSLVLLLAITAGAWWLGRRRQGWAPFAGWLLFLGMLVPVVGLVQVGRQSMADRYTYLPYIGLFVMLAAALHWVAKRGSAARLASYLVAALAVAACVPVTQRQVEVWRNSTTLWGHALNVTENNWLAHNNLGNELSERGRDAEALRQYDAAIAIASDYALAHFNRGSVLCELGRVDEGIAAYERAIELDPRSASALNNLGNQLALKGRFGEAERLFERALEISPQMNQARVNLAFALLLGGRLDDARPHFETLVESNPRQPRWQRGLASSLLLSDPARAVRAAQTAVDLTQRRDGDALEVLARALGASGREAEARRTMAEAATVFARNDRTRDADRLRAMLQGMTAAPDSP